MVVGQNLHLHVPGVNHEALREHRSIAKTGQCLITCSLEGIIQLPLCPHDTHATAAATVCCFENNWEAALLGKSVRSLCRCESLHCARHHRHPALRRSCPGLGLVAHLQNGFRLGANEYDAFLRTAPCKVAVLTEEPVARVDAVNPFILCHLQDSLDVKVALDGLHVGCPDWVALVSLVAMLLQPVRRGVDGDSSQAKLCARPEDSNCDLPSVGYQDLFKWRQV
mmetsp:Transcript_17105/g.51156  ORF Transcript_17105/g.51156 Transcript_17105/m.51156 type:complete len:224 (+) Transcript_17105:2562-3233(+)